MPLSDQVVTMDLTGCISTASTMAPACNRVPQRGKFEVWPTTTPSG